jgi:hypothetical protein
MNFGRPRNGRLLGVACFPLGDRSHLAVLVVTGMSSQMLEQQRTLLHGAKRGPQGVLQELRHVREQTGWR